MKNKITNLFLNSIKFTLGSFIFLSVIDKFLISFRKVKESYSMSPSFNPHSYPTDYIIIWKLNYVNNIIKRKGLTFMNHPLNEDKEIVRYIAAFQGEWVKDKVNDIYHKIPEGFCWVECLNGNDDSNSWGPVPVALLKGRPIMKIRPMSKFVTGKKIELNIKKRLKLDDRILDEDVINSFFL